MGSATQQRMGHYLGAGQPRAARSVAGLCFLVDMGLSWTVAAVLMLTRNEVRGRHRRHRRRCAAAMVPPPAACVLACMLERPWGGHVLALASLAQIGRLFSFPLFSSHLSSSHPLAQIGRLFSSSRAIIVMTARITPLVAAAYCLVGIFYSSMAVLHGQVCACTAASAWPSIGCRSPLARTAAHLDDDR